MSILTKESNYAIFEYQEADREIVELISEYLDNYAVNAYKFFQIKPRCKVLFSIIQTKKEFDESIYNETGRKVEDWVVGTSLGGKEIRLLSFNDYKNNKTHKNNTLNDYKKTALHEFTHFVNAEYLKERNCEGSEKFLSEGIACYISGQYENVSEIKSSLEEILGRKTAYGDFKVLVKYLVENYDKHFVLSLFESREKANNFLKKELFNKAKESCNNKTIIK